jgi:hypothetical protein
MPSAFPGARNDRDHQFDESSRSSVPCDLFLESGGITRQQRGHDVSGSLQITEWEGEPQPRDFAAALLPLVGADTAATAPRTFTSQS